MRNIPINASLARVKHVEMVLKTDRIGLESRRVDYMRDDPPPFLFRREPADNGVEPLRVKPFPRLWTINHGIRLLGLPRPLQLAMNKVRRIEKGHGAISWFVAQKFFQPEVDNRPRRNLKTNLLKQPLSQRHPILAAMRWRRGHMNELLLARVVNNLRERVIMGLQIREGGGFAGRRDPDLTLFLPTHQLDDHVLLQNLVIVERTGAAVKQVNMIDRSLGKHPLPKGLVIKPVAEASGNDGDNLATCRHQLNRQPDKRCIEIDCLQSDYPEESPVL